MTGSLAYRQPYHQGNLIGLGGHHAYHACNSGGGDPLGNPYPPDRGIGDDHLIYTVSYDGRSYLLRITVGIESKDSVGGGEGSDLRRGLEEVGDWHSFRHGTPPSCRRRLLNDDPILPIRCRSGFEPQSYAVSVDDYLLYCLSPAEHEQMPIIRVQYVRQSSRHRKTIQDIQSGGGYEVDIFCFQTWREYVLCDSTRKVYPAHLRKIAR